MKTLHLYLTRQVLLSLAMTVAVFTFVLLLGNVLKEIIALLVARQITLTLVLKAIGLLIPYVMAYVLPFAMLTATILVFGRFSADQELNAVRASGISLLSLITPVLLLSLVLCILCGAINLWFAPVCRDAYKDLVRQLDTKTISNLITEDRFIDEIPGLVLYVRKKSGDELDDVRIYTIQTNQITSRLSAKTGKMLWDEAARQIAFELSSVLIEQRIERRDNDLVGPPAPEGLSSDWQPGYFGVYTTPPYDLSALQRSARKPRLREMSINQLLEQRAELESRGISAMPVRVQMHRQVAFSFACFAFTLIGIPLAIRAHRRETSIGVAIALSLVLVYYSFLIVAEALESRDRFAPHLLVWLPNILFQVIGGILLFRANKAGG